MLTLSSSRWSCRISNRPLVNTPALHGCKFKPSFLTHPLLTNPSLWFDWLWLGWMNEWMNESIYEKKIGLCTQTGPEDRQLHSDRVRSEPVRGGRSIIEKACKAVEVALVSGVTGLRGCSSEMDLSSPARRKKKNCVVACWLHVEMWRITQRIAEKKTFVAFCGGKDRSDNRWWLVEMTNKQ